MHRYLNFIIILIIIMVAFYTFSRIYFPNLFEDRLELRDSNLEEVKNFELKFVGSVSCLNCHQEYNQYNNSRHRNVNCESCHNSGITHIEMNSNGPELQDNKCTSCHNNTISFQSSMEKVNKEICVTCHVLNVKLDSKSVTQVDIENHSKLLDCITCHNIHYPSIDLDLPPFIPHLTENKQDCRLCHSENSKFTIFTKEHEDRPNFICFVCHNVSAGNKEIIPHIIRGRLECIFCHDSGSIEPLDNNHPAIPIRSDSCLECHGAGGVKPRTREHTKTFVREDLCNECHGVIGIYPLSNTHVERNVDECLKCHREDGT